MGQSESRPKLWQIPRKSPFSVDNERAEKLREKCGKFRILVIGRANAGKTTILQKTCDTTEDPIIYDSKGKEIPPSVLESSAQRGVHDIENEMVFKSNPGFRFHDSRGFESGGIDELERVKAFISNRSKERKLADQLHAIWYCIPMDDCRPFTAAEDWFFAECGTGTVPVVAIFTKFDALDNIAFRTLRDEEKSLQDASRLAPERAVTDFENTHLKTLRGQRYPPKAHVYLRDMNKEGSKCVQLIERTAAALNNEVLQQLFVSTQRNSVELCMHYAIERGAKRVFDRDYKGYILNSDDVKRILSLTLCWFPQYAFLRLPLNRDDLRRRDDRFFFLLREEERLRERRLEEEDLDLPLLLREYLHPSGDKLYSRLYSFSETLEPIQKSLYFIIATVIVADFEYLIWNARYKDTITKALAIYEKHASTQAIIQSTEEAFKSFQDRGSKEKLSQQMLQIALKNRLKLELLEDPKIAGLW